MHIIVVVIDLHVDFEGVGVRELDQGIDLPVDLLLVGLGVHQLHPLLVEATSDSLDDVILRVAALGPGGVLGLLHDPLLVHPELVDL